jgi:hypothetical protein
MVLSMVPFKRLKYRLSATLVTSVFRIDWYVILFLQYDMNMLKIIKQLEIYIEIY